MSQTAWLVALSAVAVVSAILSFVAWSLLARSPVSLPSTDEDETTKGDDGAIEAEDADDEAAEHEEEDPEPN